MKFLMILCAVAQWILVTGNPPDVCIMGNARYLFEDKELDMSQLTGNWYTLYIFPKNVTDEFSCWISTFDVNPDGTMNLQYSYYNQSMEQRHSSRATLNQMMRGAFRHDYSEDVEFNADYYILDTDYKQFTINGGCPKGWDVTRKVMWIDFRSKDPSDAAQRAVRKALQKLGLEMSDFGDFCPDKSHFF